MWKRSGCGKRSRVWTFYVKDELDWTEFSYAIAVMDRTGGWIEGRGDEDGSLIERKIVASMWMYTTAVICKGQKHIDVFRKPEKELDYRNDQQGMYALAGGSRVGFRILIGIARNYSLGGFEL